MQSLLIALALFLRVILVFNPGFEADVSFWKSWGLATYDKGIVEGMKVTNNNYPTPFAYTLGSMVWIYSLFKDPHNFNEFWSNTNVLFLGISKLFPILADFGIAAIIWKITKNRLFALFYLFNPLSLMDGAWWGQVDALGVFIFLLALLALLKTKNFLAGVLFMFAMMTKLQNMIYGPIFFLLIFQRTGLTGLTQAVVGALIGFFGLNIEFVLSRNMDRVLASLTENYDYFPWMSLNAFNLWWIVTGAKGMATSDKLNILGLLNAKTVGLLLFSSMYLFAMLRQFLSNEKTTLRSFFESLIIVNAAFFLFQTQSHDRYAFPLSVFLLLWAPFIKNFKLFTVCYVLFTLFYSYNLHTALIWNYPQNGLPIPTWSALTMITSVVLLSLFGVFLTRLKYWIFPFVVTAIALFMLNIPLLQKKPISLTKYTPYISEQSYGQRQTNRSVQSSFGGPNGWTRLSVQYAFYKTGIGTHANSKHVFDINGKYKTFTTDFGIDTEAGTKSSAIFEIYGDNTLLFRSEKMGRFDLPKHADVHIQGVKKLSLITTDAGDGNYDDHTDWLNPILWP